CPQVRTILVPVGGGGLAAGIAVAVQSLDPSVRGVGVQAEAGPGVPAPLPAGPPGQGRAPPTIADGLAGQRAGGLPLRILGLRGRAGPRPAAVPGARQAGGGTLRRGGGRRAALLPE